MENNVKIDRGILDPKTKVKRFLVKKYGNDYVYCIKLYRVSLFRFISSVFHE